jgi:hypothetical protein
MLGPSVIAAAFARGQQRAQRDASHLFIGNLASEDADHHLVEQHKSLINAARRNQRQTFVGSRPQLERAIVELACDGESQIGELA